MPEANPLDICHQALWTLAESSAAFTSRVKPTNRIKYTSQPKIDPSKDQIGTGDLPEVSLVMQSLSGGLKVTSSSSRMVARWSWVVSTGDFHIDRSLTPVLWALYCAMAPWITVANAVTWKGKTFVKRVDVQEAQIGLLDRERNRGIAGFSAIWTTEVEMYFTTSDVLTSAGES